jgi:hypothetical protein
MRLWKLCQRRGSTILRSSDILINGIKEFPKQLTSKKTLGSYHKNDIKL